MKSKPRGYDCVVERVAGRMGTPYQVGGKTNRSEKRTKWTQ